MENKKIKVTMEDFNKLAGLTSLIDSNPRNINAYYARIEMNEKLGMYAEVIKDAKILAQLKPDASIYNTLGWYQYLIGDNQVAVKSCSESIRLDPTFAYAYDSRGHARLSLGLYEEAIEDFTASIQKRKAGDPVVTSLSGRAIANKKLGLVTQANSDYAEAKRQLCVCPDDFYERGNAHKVFGNYDEAMKDYNKALESNPNHRSAQAALEEIKALKSVPSSSADQRKNKTLTDCNMAIALNPRNAEAYHTRIQINEALGNYEAAIEDYKTLIQMKPNAPDYNNMGWCQYLIGDNQAAIKSCSEAIRLDPTCGHAYDSRGHARLSLGQYKEAIEDFSTSIQIRNNVSCGTSWSGGAIANKKLGLVQQANSNYAEAKKQPCTCPDDFYERGNVHKVFGNYDEAVKDYNKVLELQPNYRPAKAALKEAKDLKDTPSSLPQMEAGKKKDPQENIFQYFFQQMNANNEPKTPPKKSTPASPNTSFELNFSISYSDLKFGDKIGEGSYGEVHSGTWEYNAVAIKKLKLTNYNQSALEELENEAKVMAKMRSDYLVQLKGITMQKPNFCLVMELMPKGSLDNLLYNAKNDLPWSMRYRLAMDITTGIYHLHNQNILHRDLKSMNILLTNEGRAKLCDFGLAKVKATTRTQTSKPSKSVGTIPWMAPEILVLNAKFSTKSDIYALAMVFWEIAAREQPYAQVTEESIIKDAIKEGERAEIPEKTPKKFAELIRLCWTQKPEERPEAIEVLRKLESCAL
ncbi:MAG: protein kinase [Proteobacteria bacterium]|nr:protein kinase [Pseudomonadota bacterium]